MKNFILFVFSLAVFMNTVTAEGFQVNYNEPQPGLHQLTFMLSDYSFVPVVISNNSFTSIQFDASVFTQKKGYAQLPYMGASVMISPDKDVDLKILEGEYEEYQLDYPLVPSRGVIYRDQDPSTIPYVIDSRSIVDKWYPENLAEMNEPFIIRDIRGTSVYVYPFRYNAATQTVRVYKTMTVQVIENNSNPVNPLIIKNEVIAREMDAIYKSVFVNYDESKYDLTIGQNGEILVLTTSAYEAAIEPYIQWKKEKGFIVHKEVVAVGTNVKTNILNAYTANNNILYVQLVGDWADIKSDMLSGYAPMDPQLGCVVGSDQQPDICIGRFSASNATHVTTQVNKVIGYEKTPDMAGNWYSTSTGIASNQGPGDDNELDYQHIQNIYDNKLDPFTFDNQNEIYEPGATITMVSNAINTGTAIINYCGHGSETSWGTTGFSNNNIQALTNGNKLPFIFSVACVNGAFNGSGDCFAEAWMKKENGGAVMTLMATINQPWDPPMRGEDYFNDILTGGYDYSAHPGQNGISTTEQRSTLGAIVFNGLVLMTTEAGSTSDWETAKTWTFFGDPAMQPRTDTPADITLSNEIVLVGIPFITTITGPDGPVEGAMVCLSQGDQYFSGTTDASGTVSIDNTLSPGIAKLVVTGFNTETIYQDVTVVPPGGAWVIAESYTVDDSQGNNNGQADYGEQVMLDVVAKNVGSATANNVTATLMSTDGFITITDATHTFGNIGANATVLGDDAFGITVAQNAPDNHMALCQITFSDGDKSNWTSNISIILHSAVLELGDFTINDASGNNNGKLDPGETVQLSIEISNSGSSGAANVSGLLNCADPLITITQNSMSYGNISGGATASQSYSVTANAATPAGHSAAFVFNMTGDMGITATDQFNIIVGQIPVLVIDLDGNNNSAPALVQAFEDNGVSVEYSTTFNTNLDLYSSIFLCLGIYPDNHVLSSAEGQSLADFLNIGGRLYMEGGDTWYYDTPTAVHGMFNINATEDGSGDLATQNGQTGTFCEGLAMSYTGENNWIDHIEPTGTAVQIFKNSSPVYGTAVAYEGSSFKTIGASFEFGGLADGTAPNTKQELIARISEFFDLGGQSLTAYFQADDTQICEGEDVTFTDFSTGNVTSWDWSFPGGSPASSTEQNPVVTYNVAGVYDVTLTVSDGTETNTFIASGYITVNVCTGSEKTFANAMVIYPVPSNGSFSILFSNETGNTGRISVLNPMGKVIFTGNDIQMNTGLPVQFDLGSVPAGLYMITVESDKGTFTKRILIK